MVSLTFASGTRLANGSDGLTRSDGWPERTNPRVADTLNGPDADYSQDFE
jgi:hypothetical protein